MSLVFIFLLTTLVVYFIKSKYKLLLLGRKIVGPWMDVPLLGNVKMISKLRPEYLFVTVMENRIRFRQTYRMWLGPQLWVFLHSTKETSDALKDSSLVRADTFQQLSILIGNGLLISEGKHWETHRRALGPAFHPNVLNRFAPTISKHVDVLIGKICDNQKKSIEASEYLFPCIFDSIMETSMGINLNAQLDPEGTYTNAFHNTSELLFKRMVNPLLTNDFIFRQTKIYEDLQNSVNIIHKLMDTVIQERAVALQKNLDGNQFLDKDQRTLLTILLTTEIDGQSLSFQEIRDEVNTFIFAGVDTTTAAMSFILYSLAKYPDEQRLVFDEITQNITEELTIPQLNSLTYLEMFIKECLRLYTIVPMTGRQTTRPTKIGDIEYCAGVTLWINMYGLAHDDELFENPMEFRASRFGSMENLEPFSFLPFSGGPHVCIGRKYAMLIIKILIVKILTNFEISLKDPDEKIILMAQMVLKSLNGIHLVCKTRDPENS